MALEKKAREPVSARRFWQALLFATFTGTVLVALPFFGIKFFDKMHVNSGEYTLSLIFILPIVQGFAAAFKVAPNNISAKRFFLFSMCVLAVDFILAFVFLREGYVCFIMTAPLYFFLVGAGFFVGDLLSQVVNRKVFYAATIPMVLLFSTYDAANTTPSYKNAVSDAVTIAATPDVVWKYIIAHPENKTPPEYWLWKIGMPMPIQSTSSGRSVGASRECRFTTGIAFKEKIVEIVPNKSMSFIVTEQPKDPEVIGHFSLDKGLFDLTDNHDGTTTVVATSWYHLYVQPAGYFDLWTTDIIRKVHMRVLNHIKRLAEQKAGEKA